MPLVTGKRLSNSGSLLVLVYFCCIGLLKNRYFDNKQLCIFIGLSYE